MDLIEEEISIIGQFGLEVLPSIHTKLQSAHSTASLELKLFLFGTQLKISPRRKIENISPQCYSLMKDITANLGHLGIT